MCFVIDMLLMNMNEGCHVSQKLIGVDYCWTLNITAESFGCMLNVI